MYANTELVLLKIEYLNNELKKMGSGVYDVKKIKSAYKHVKAIEKIWLSPSANLGDAKRKYD